MVLHVYLLCMQPCVTDAFSLVNGLRKTTSMLTICYVYTVHIGGKENYKLRNTVEVLMVKCILRLLQNVMQNWKATLSLGSLYRNYWKYEQLSLLTTQFNSVNKYPGMSPLAVAILFLTQYREGEARLLTTAPMLDTSALYMFCWYLYMWANGSG